MSRWMTSLVWMAAMAVAWAAPADRAGDPGRSWRFALGAASERLQVTHALDAEAFAEVVTLPHRVLQPNRSLWYDAQLDLDEGRGWSVDADDGAQVFIDGRQVPMRGRVFLPPAGARGSHRVTVRVLNNAMAGGLRGVRELSTDETRAALSVHQGPEAPSGYLAAGAPSFAARMPGPDRPCRFTAWADSQSGAATFRRVVDGLAREDTDLSIAAGDLVSDGSSPAAWTEFLHLLAPLLARTPAALVAGNHDYDGDYDTLQAAGYRRALRRGGVPWFAWSCGPVRFMAIDVNTQFPIGIDRRSVQGRFVEHEAASREWRRATWRVLVVHQPPWSRSWLGYDGDEAVRTWVRKLAAGSGLDLVISGHSHAYERLRREVGGREVTVLITGGAGGALEDAAAGRLDGDGGDRVVVRHHYVRATADRDALSWEAVDLEGVVIDRVTLPARRPGERRLR